MPDNGAYVKPSRRSRIRQRIAAAIVAVLVVIVLGVAVVFPGGDHCGSAAAGERVTVTMPDGELVDVTDARALQSAPPLPITGP